MNPRSSTLTRAGIRRGLIEFRQDFSPNRLVGQLFWPVVTLAAMYLFRDHHVDGVALGAMMLPSVLGMFSIFGMQLMVLHLATDREDGTLLRARSTPGGIHAYLVGKSALCTLTIVTYLAVIAVPGAFIVDGMATPTLTRTLTVTWVLVLGMAASQALGAVLGALVPTVRAAGYAGALLMGLIAISGVFYPITSLPSWLQHAGQSTPIYWVGHGMRAALLPNTYSAPEPGGTWRLGTTAIVLTAWTLGGSLMAPRTLRAMTGRESASRIGRGQQRAFHRSIQV